MIEAELATELQRLAAVEYAAVRYMRDRNAAEGRDTFSAEQIAGDQAKAAGYAESARFWLGLTDDSIRNSKLEIAIDQLDAELQRLYGSGLDAEQLECLRNPDQYGEAIGMLDDMESRMGVSSHVRGEVADALLAPFSTLAEIQDAVRAGRRVHWRNEGYTVGMWTFKDGTESWYVVFHTGDSVKLTESEYRAADFFIGE